MKIIKDSSEIKYYKNFSFERWCTFSFNEQMANVGADIGRTINWRSKDIGQSRKFFEGGVELFDLTIKDPKNNKKRNELLVIRKELGNYFLGSNFSESADKKWNNYFYGFNHAVAVERNI